MKATFIKSSHNLRQCPPESYGEFLFIGRSNVWKSTLINALTNTKLAKTWAKPGKTQLINHFLIDDSWYLVDLPGYWYAKKAKSKRSSWDRLFWEYLGERENIEYICVLIDGSIPIQDIDLEFMNNLADRQVPFVIVYTKTDKLKSSELKKLMNAKKTQLLKEREILPPIFITSSKKKSGLNELIDFLDFEANR